MPQHTDHTDTLLAHSGRADKQAGGAVNTPVYRGSTLLYPTVDALRSVSGTPHTRPCLEHPAMTSGGAISPAPA